jgi:hypothetical protein
MEGKMEHQNQLEKKFDFLVIGNDPTNVNSLFGAAILDMKVNQATAAWDPQGRVPQDSDQFLMLFLTSLNEIAAVIETTQTPGSEAARLDIVMIKPTFQGQRLCKPFVKMALTHLLSLGFRRISVDVFSKTLDGIPACLCYYRAAKELNLQVYHVETNTKLPLLNEALCLIRGRNDLSMEFSLE